MEHKYIVVRTVFTPYGERKEEEDSVYEDRIAAEKYASMRNSICESNISYTIRKVNVFDRGE